MLFAKISDSFCSGVGSVTERPPAGFSFKFIDYLGRKPVRIGRQRVVTHHTTKLPVPYRRVLAHTQLNKTSKSGCRRLCSRGTFHTIDIEKSQPRKVRKMKILRFRYRGKCVTPLVAKRRGIGSSTNPKTVQHH